MKCRVTLFLQIIHLIKGEEKSSDQNNGDLVVAGAIATQLGVLPGHDDGDMVPSGAIAAQLGVLPDQAPWPDSESHWSHIGDFHTFGLKGENHDHLSSEPAFEDKYRNSVPGRNDVSGYNMKPSFNMNPSLHKSVSNHYNNPSHQILPRQSRYYNSELNAPEIQPNNAVVPNYYTDKENTGGGFTGGNPSRPGPSNFFHSFPPVPLEAYVPPGGGKQQQQSQQSPQYYQPPPSPSPPSSPQYPSHGPNQPQPATPQLFKHLPGQYNHNGQNKYNQYKRPYHGNPQPPPPPPPPSHANKRGIRPQAFNLPRASYQQVNFPLRAPRDNGFVIVGGGPPSRFPPPNFIPPGGQGGPGPAGKPSLVSGDPFLPGEKLEIEEDFASFSHSGEPLLFDRPNSNYPPNTQQNNDFGFDNFDDTPHDFSFSLEDNKDFVTLEFGDEKPNSKEFTKYETQDSGFENFSQENGLQAGFDGEANSEERFAKPDKEDNSNFEKVPEEFMDFMKHKERYNNNKYSSEQNSGYENFENKGGDTSNSYLPQKENEYDNYNEKPKFEINKYAIEEHKDINQQNDERFNSQKDFSVQDYGKRNIRSKDYISSQYGNKDFKEENRYNPPSYSSPPKNIPTERSPAKVVRVRPPPSYQPPRVQQSYREPINVQVYNKEDVKPQFIKEETTTKESTDYPKAEQERRPENKYLADYQQNKNAADDNSNNAPQTNNEDNGGRNNFFNDFSDFSDLESEYEDGGFDDWLKSGDAKDSDFDFGNYGDDDKQNQKSNQELKFLDNESDSRKRSDLYNYDYDYYSNDAEQRNKYDYPRHHRQQDNRRSMRVSQSQKYQVVKTLTEPILDTTKHIIKKENEDRSPWIPIFN